jgi:uncharacterized protein YydD (DUF2326 family)
MEITVDAICKEFDIRPEEVFAFMDEMNIHLGGDFMHDIAIDLPDFRKFVEYRRQMLRDQVTRAQADLEQLDDRVDDFLRRQKDIRYQDFE